jgi:FKBP-type peptidyl-prolyl cis-trans isomerase FkpA
MRKVIVLSVSGVLVATCGLVGLRSAQMGAVANARGNGGSMASSNGQPGGKMAADLQTNGPSNTGRPSASASADFSQYASYADKTEGLVVDLDVGDGAEAAEGNSVTVNYRGWLTDGKVFDESYKRGQPFVFALGRGQVIAGWDQGVKGMKVGGKRRLVLPPALGYGARGAGGSIPPNAVLIFDVELLAVQ